MAVELPPYRPQLAQCGAIALGTPQLEVSLKFFRDILGMEEVERVGDTVYLRGYQEMKHHSLVLFQNDTATVDSYSFRVSRPEDVELFYNQLLADEVEVVELPTGHQAGRGTAIRFVVPHAGHTFELYYDIDAPEAPEEIRSRLLSNSSRRRGLGVRRLDHYNIQAGFENVGKAEQWLQNSLGFKRREYVHLPDHPDMLIASWSAVTSQVHDLAIAMSMNNQDNQLHHVAFNLENHSDLLVAADTLRDLDVHFNCGPGKHGIGQAMYLYLREPGSGHRIELYSGGYHIFDPDWKALGWEPTNQDGMTWFGQELDVTQDGEMATSTESVSSLTSLIGQKDPAPVA
ncbi:catechol 1,2-dioxygenase [Gordonia amarae]|uniref:Catechol 1,2-dioxygenase n=2 Tax=Gordonia amarae TaxID=36821 RepID=A0A857LQF4_9ACTN|nr:VOC family protein [Gordonia amarae]MCS3880454.1 catechol 2,3-dioxygenase [Gordonia amarae]QHN18786.1 catechol 1,2-dioxygenase [Gordonia amarae]QHN23261.1 catechol 1,2-dioxygenase [Gordonia amarae]QHN32163.1 catechol 1,2-dioxygenase [Gordonia amarae]QHN40909.1 catechol 1,2-dioxygenase [Gordonia amarae]